MRLVIEIAPHQVAVECVGEAGNFLGGDRPLVIDAKVTSARASWWLEEAFKGH